MKIRLVKSLRTQSNFIIREIRNVSNDDLNIKQCVKKKRNCVEQNQKIIVGSFIQRC